MKNDIHARHSRTGNVTAEDSHDSLHVTPHIGLVILTDVFIGLDLTYVATLIFKNNIRSCAQLDSIVILF